MKDLERVRKEIDALDKEIVKNYLKRLELCKEVFRAKKKTGKAIEDGKREREIIEKITEGVPSEYREYVKSVYERIFANSKQYQSEMFSQKYCLIGEKLSHSYSSDIHGFSGLDYSLEEVENASLGKFVKESGYNGFNVTAPYKERVIPFLDEVDERAREIGSVNTVLRRDGKLIGFNTDIDGMEYLLTEHKVGIKGKNAVILGSGGTGKTAKYLLEKTGAKKITVVSRKGEINYLNCYRYISDCNVLINATPVGTFGEKEDSLIDLSKLPKLSFVLDVVYNPFKTKLLLQAESLGIKNANGLDMLIRQALESERIWGYGFNRDFEAEVRGFIKAKYRNLVLYGMPSSGKTTVGEMLAKKLEKPFYDTDCEIEKEYGKKPSGIIEERGEEYFREIESRTVKKLSELKGAVISLGGGTVLRRENVELLKANGFFVYLKRNKKNLVTENRPLSQKNGVSKLFKERKKIYNSIYNIIIKNNKTIEKAVEDTARKYEDSCY